MAELVEEAKAAADRMADLMEDQLVEGRFPKAMSEFIDDLTTFPAAILKGPVLHKKPVLKWQPDGKGGFTPAVTQELRMEWERVDPFCVYPAPSATTVDNGFMIERHSLSREDLNALIGVEGYDDASIRMVLEQYSYGGLREWWQGLAEQYDAEGKSTIGMLNNSEGNIDALQYWGSVQGQWLVDWGMPKAQIPDPTLEYHCEVWLIGNWVIKAVLNYDPLNRKPYYKDSYEEIPGNWWGSSICDLVRDCQQVCNATARALVNNMAVASGPQVTVNVSRLAAGEEVTTVRPWRIWQVKDDPLSGPSPGTVPPVAFYQPSSNVQELLAVFNQFTALADDYSGIPRYMSGQSTGGAGRTASGLSMLINNAGKAIKSVITSIDGNIMTPLLERLYTHNMLFATDPALKGDVNVVARGAEGLMAKEAVQVRRNEFLQATGNPIDMQIIGLKGRAAILRETAKDLGMDVNDIVPPEAVLDAKIAAQAAMAAQAQAGPPGAPPAGGPGEAPTPLPMQPAHAVAAAPHAPMARRMHPPPEQLQNGAPVSDHFTPPKVA
jgi:hypothetical protein